MNSAKHDAALRRKTAGSKIFKKRFFKGNRYRKCINSAAASSDILITASKLKSTFAKKIITKINFYCNSVANMESGNEELLLDNNFLPSATLLIERYILKSIIKLPGTFPNCSNKSIDFKCDQ